jgi:alpha-L-rhamnosidase
MNAEWISNGTAKPFYARKIIEIKEDLTKAVARVCGLGQFNFYIDGKKVGDHVLDPGWTDYNKLVQFVEFDVTDYLNCGESVLAAEVGNGWYNMMTEGYSFHFPEFMPPNPNPYKPYGECLCLAVELKLTYADGNEETITTGNDWKVAPHKVTMSNVYGSEIIDNRQAISEWNTFEIDDSDWQNAVVLSDDEIPKGKLALQTQPPIKAIKTYTAKYLHTVNGRRIYDLGQNISGMFKIKLKGKSGDIVKLYPAEKLDSNGDVDQMAKNWMLIDTVITLVIDESDKWESFNSTFAYFAGRYFAVEGNAEIGKFTADAITSAWKTDGKFTCDDERYNKIYNMIERTVEANMLSVHTDCPTIERFAWQEPNHLMAPSIFYMKNGNKLWDKFLTDIRVGQHTKEDCFNDFAGGKFYPGDGLVPAQAPCYIPNVLPVPGMGSFYDIIAWGSTSILGAWWHYWFYGDKKILEDNFECGKRYLNHLKNKVTPDGFINHGLGDWGNPENQFARENVETAFLYADAITLAKMANVLDKTDEEDEFISFAESVKENYNEKLLVKNPNTGKWCYKVWGDDFLTTQASEALPLYWGMVPSDKKDDVIEEFRNTLTEKGSFVSGEVGLPYIIQTAAECGFNDLVAKFITKSEHPSYYAFVLDGETTLGEYWENNPRSHCHDMMGHIIEWYYNSFAGIKPLEAGFKKIMLKPYLPKSMNEMHCEYNSASGLIKVDIIREDGMIKVSLNVPNDIEVKTDFSNLKYHGEIVAFER